MHIHSFYNLTYDYSSLCILILVIVAMKSMTQFSFNFGEQRFCDFAPSYKSDSSSVKIFYFLISRLTSSLFLFPTNTVGSNELNYPTLAFFFSSILKMKIASIWQKVSRSPWSSFLCWALLSSATRRRNCSSSSSPRLTWHTKNNITLVIIFIRMKLQIKLKQKERLEIREFKKGIKRRQWKESYILNTYSWWHYLFRKMPRFKSRVIEILPTWIADGCLV